MNRIFVGFGLLFLVAGLLVSAFTTQETDYETVEADNNPLWDINTLTLAPSGQDQDSTFYGRLMTPGMWFQLNISASGSVELQVSNYRQDLGKVPIFGPITGTTFNQNVPATGTGTYFIDIRNESPTPVTLDGNVLTWQLKTSYRTVYPYLLPSGLMIISGACAIIYGILKKHAKSSKFRSTKSKNIKKMAAWHQL